MARLLPLVCLALLHTLVDTCALMIEPLWPALESAFGLLGVAALSMAFVLQSLPTSLSQAVFGYLCDRRSRSYLIWLGPVLAAVFLPMMGISPDKTVLAVLLIVGGIGVGAFHPEAAVLAGRVFPEHRTRALAVFMFGGALGLALGPTLSGAVVSRFGLGGLVFLAPPLLLLVVVLWRVGRLGEVAESIPNRAANSGFAGMMQGRIGLAAALLVVCSLRLVPNMAMAKVLSFEMARRGYGEFATGLSQSLFLASASAGMMAMAWKFRTGWEQRFMVYSPLAGIPLLFLMGWSSVPQWMFLALLVPTGMVLWGTTPAMVSYGQQLFPYGTGLASAITMGLSWGLGGLIQAPVTAYFQNAGVPQQAYHAFILPLLCAALGAWLLPSTTEELAGASANVEHALPEAQPSAVDA